MRSRKLRLGTAGRSHNGLVELLDRRILFTDVPQQTINTAVTWTAANSPYNLTYYVSVGAGGSLTIQSGVTVTGYPLTIASGGKITAIGTTFNSALTAQAGSSGSITKSTFVGTPEFDSTGVSVSTDAFKTNPSVYPTFVPALIANSDTFVAGSTINIQQATVNTAITLPVVNNVSAYNFSYYETIGSGGSLTVNSGVNLTGYPLTIASGGTLNATGVNFNCALTAQVGSSGSIAKSSFIGTPEFDGIGVSLSTDAFKANPSVYPTDVPTVIGNGNSFVAGTTINVQQATINTPLTLPVVTNVSAYNFSYYETVGSGGSLTVNSGVNLTGYPLTIAAGGSINAVGVNFNCAFTAQAGSTGSITSSKFIGTPEFDATGVALASDAFSANPSVYPTFLATLTGNNNSFVTGTTINLQQATLTTSVVVPPVKNVSTYNLNYYTDVASGATLTLENGVILTGYPLTIDSGGTLSAIDATFDGTLNLAAGSKGTLEYNLFNAPLNVDGKTTAFIQYNDFSSSLATVAAQGTGGPISMLNNWWGTTVAANIAAKITDKADNANLPQVIYSPFLSAKPVFVVSLVATPPAAQTATVNVSKSFSLGSFTQSFATAPYTITVGWGDGTANTALTTTAAGAIPSSAHIYTSSGAKTLTVTVTDALGHTSKVTGTITVASAITGTISGTVFNDLNLNGKQDAGELGLSGVTVFLDTNNDTLVTTGETSVKTDASGKYTFTGLQAGTFHVREVLPTGYAPIAPVTGEVDVALTTGQVVAGKSFADALSTGKISGRVFNDADGDKKLNHGELGLGGYVVFIDLKGTGVVATGDPTVTTAPDGTWTFSNLLAGTYKVMVEPVSGATLTTTELTITLAAGGSSLTNVFGEKGAA